MICFYDIIKRQIIKTLYNIKRVYGSFLNNYINLFFLRPNSNLLMIKEEFLLIRENLENIFFLGGLLVEIFS